MALTEDHVPAGSSPTGEAAYGPTSIAAAQGLPPEASQLGEVWRRFRRNRLAFIGMVIVGIEVLAAVFAPLITFFNPTKNDLSLGPTGPSLKHWFGTDIIGRDLYARVVYGSRVSLKVGILSLLIALAIGLVMGALAGFYGGMIDGLLMRLTDIFLAFPYIVAAIVLIVVIGRGLNTVILVLGFLGWMPFARLFRSSILQIKELEYIEAARAVGCSDFRIIVRHMLPNAIQPVVVYGTIFVGTAVLSEAALSFLGVGALEPTPAWGLMVSDGQRYISDHPGMLFFPGAAIFLTVMAFVFMGDGLRDALDPRLR